MRPNLTKEISFHDFKEYYWLKSELQLLCKENGINTTGSKMEITERIETFLLTGEIKKASRNAKKKIKPKSNEVLSLDTVITEDHRCSQEVRAFFKTVINPKFHFSTYIQTYFKENTGKTYHDVVHAWYEEEERRKDPSYKKKIAPQFEYNQFIRDFFADPKNKEKSREEAIESWNRLKKLPGGNRYKLD